MWSLNIGEEKPVLRPGCKGGLISTFAIFQHGFIEAFGHQANPSIKE